MKNICVFFFFWQNRMWVFTQLAATINFFVFIRLFSLVAYCVLSIRLLYSFRLDENHLIWFYERNNSSLTFDGSIDAKKLMYLMAKVNDGERSDSVSGQQNGKINSRHFWWWQRNGNWWRQLWVNDGNWWNIKFATTTANLFHKNAKQREWKESSLSCESIIVGMYAAALLK